MPNENDILAKYGVKAPAEPADESAILAKYGVSAPAGRDASSTTPASPQAPVEDNYDGPQFAAPDAAQANAQPVLTEASFADKLARKHRAMTEHNATVVLTNKILGVKPVVSDIDRAQSLGLVGDLVAEGVNFAMDPVARMAGSGLAKAVTKIPGVSKLFNSMGELAANKVAAELEMQALNEMGQSVRNYAASKYYMAKVLSGSIKGAADFGGTLGTQNVANQVATDNYSLDAFADSVYRGARDGALLGGGAAVLELGLGALLRARDPMLSRPDVLEKAAEKAAPTLQKHDAFMAAKEAEGIATFNKQVSASLDSNISALEGRRLKLQEQAKGTPLDADGRAAFERTYARVEKDLEVLKAKKEAMINPAIGKEDPALQALLSGERSLTDAEITRVKTVADMQAQRAAEIQFEIKTKEAARQKALERSVDPRAKKAAEIEVRTEQLRREVQDFRTQAEAIKSDPNRLTLSPADYKKLDRLETQAKFREGQISLLEKRLESVPAPKTEKADVFGAEIEALNQQLNDVSTQSALAHKMLERAGIDHASPEAARLVEQLQQARDFAQRSTENSHAQFGEKLEKINQAIADKEAAKQITAYRLSSNARPLKPAEASTIAESTAKLDQEIAQLQQAKSEILDRHAKFVRESGPLALQLKVAGGRLTRPEFVENARLFAQSEAQRLVDRGVIKPENMNAFGEFMFRNALDAKGVDWRAARPNFGVLDGFINQLERLNLIDKRKNTMTTSVFQDVVTADSVVGHKAMPIKADFQTNFNALNKRGLPDQEAIRLLQYVEIDPLTGVPFVNKAATPFRPPYASPIPAEQLLTAYPELASLRQLDHNFYHSTPEALRPGVGYIPGHVPVMRKRGAPISTGGTRNAYDLPDSFKARSEGYWDPAIHESDPRILYTRYVDQVVRYQEMAPLIPRMQAEITKMAWMGDTEGVDTFASVMARALGIRDPKLSASAMGLVSKEDKRALADVMSSYLMNNNAPAIKQMMEAAGDMHYSKWDEVAHLVRELQYKAMVLNLRNVIKQFAQLDTVGGPEIGMSNVYAGRRALLPGVGNKSVKAVTDAVEPMLAGVDAGVLSELHGLPYQNKGLRAISWVTSQPTKRSGLEKLYSAGERANRRGAFAGAYMQFKSAAQKGEARLDGVLEGLLEGEKVKVISTLRQAGPEAAAQMYGIIRSYRINFIFSAINRPNYFSSGLGQLVPFTTWTSNQLARFVTDTTRVGAGSAAQLARRIAWPLIIDQIFRSRGFTVPGNNPVADLKNSLDFQVFPAANNVIKGAYKAADQRSLAPLAKALGGVTPGVAQYMNYKKALERNRGNVPMSILGLERVDK